MRNHSLWRRQRRVEGVANPWRVGCPSASGCGIKGSVTYCNQHGTPMRITSLRSLPLVRIPVMVDAQSPMPRCRRSTAHAWDVATYLKSVK